MNHADLPGVLKADAPALPWPVVLSDLVGANMRNNTRPVIDQRPPCQGRFPVVGFEEMPAVELAGAPQALRAVLAKSVRSLGEKLALSFQENARVTLEPEAV